MLPINPQQIPIIFRKAVENAEEGKLIDAINSLEQLAKSAPQIPEIPFQLAEFYTRKGDVKTAFSYFEKAEKLAPANAALWRSHVELMAAHGSEHEKKRLLKRLRSAKIPAPQQRNLSDILKAQAKQSGTPSKIASKSQVNQLLQLINSGRPDTAEKQARNLLRAGNDAVVSTVLGASLCAQGRLSDAEAAFKSALSVDPDFAEALTQYGQLLLEATRRNEAQRMLEKAHRIIPQNPLVLGNLGKLYHDIGQPHDAISLLDQLLAQSPNNALGLFIRAQTRLTLEDAAGTIADLDRLEKHVPATGETTALRGMAQKLLGHPDDAIATCETALTLEPNSLRVITIYANILQQQGEFDRADQVLRDALKRDVRSGAIYRMIVQGKKLASDDPVLGEMKSLWDRGNMSREARADLGFGLAKHAEAAKDHTMTWEYLSRANQAMAELYPHDIEKEKSDFRRFSDFAKDFDRSRIGTCGHQSNQTIFVTGLPRSGTTLVEQILASHSQITGGDELSIFNSLAIETIKSTVLTGGNIADLTDDTLTKLGEDYEGMVNKRLPDAGRITDKTISTYQLAPMNWLALPNAKIVALRREPRDNLWSIYKNRFVAGLHRYSYSLESLVEIYRLYDKYLAAWQDLAPGKIHEISYEALVSDPEVETRKLLEFCDLEWEDSCLEFHKTKRDVKTLSVAQVRQPLYRSSVRAWEPYQDQLAPMLKRLDALGL